MKPIAISKIVVGATLALAASALFAGEITLFERPDFQGRRLTIRGTMPNLDRTDFNDRAESIAVRDGVWEICTDAYFNGQCVRLQPGEYPNLRGSLDRSISSVRGAADPQMEITTGVAELSIRVDRAALARYGLNVSDVEEAVAAGASGDVISQVIDGPKRYTVALRLPERYRTAPDAMRDIVLRSAGGAQVALNQVAHIEVTRGPEKVDREEGQRRVVVMSNVRGRDLGSFVAEVRGKFELAGAEREISVEIANGKMFLLANGCPETNSPCCAEVKPFIGDKVINGVESITTLSSARN